jgi:hypothetical protein
VDGEEARVTVEVQSCPACEYRTSDRFDYVAWLRAADRAIDKGLNPNAVWRLHEKFTRRSDDCELGGEA